MKKSLTIFLSMLTLVFTSCFNDADDAELSPYAILKSFSIGNITSKYPAFTSDGADTISTKTIQGSSYAFSINQVTGEVCNVDSLPFGTNVDKVVINMELSGYARIYVDSIGVYENFMATDSIDFTHPRKFRITSTDSEYYRDYTISVNAHQVEPDRMVWNKYQSVDAVAPCRALEYNGELCLFGEKDGKPVLAFSSLTGVPSWNVVELNGLPSSANLSTIQLFGGALYMVAADGIYTSPNAKDWSRCYAGSGVLAIVGASDVDGKMWVATDAELLITTNGVNYANAGVLPEDFPLYGVSIASYTLNHNSTIVRYMLVGYADETMGDAPVVWSRLSTEERWTRYENANNTYSCPALKGLSVLRYDDFLYAIGGAGVAQGESVKAFSALYISRDNGITWKAPDGFYQRIPAELQGCDVPFVATVDSNNKMWIICAGEEPVVWRGIINRLGFKD